MIGTHVFVKSVKVMVAMLAAGAALTACGPVRTGAAAIVAGDRISVAKLDAAVTAWGKELPKYPAAQQIVQQSQSQGQGQQIPFDPSSPQRSALHQLLDLRAWDEVAREQGITVSRGQVDSFVAENGGWPAVDANVLAQGLPTEYAEDYARTIMIQRTLLQNYGAGAGQTLDQQKQQQIIGQVVGAYVKANRELDIDVNPRYGSFDDKQMILGPVCPRLSTPDSGTGGSASEVKCQD
jgi:hypothetical protein